jgi:hypothetical protein
VAGRSAGAGAGGSGIVKLLPQARREAPSWGPGSGTWNVGGMMTGVGEPATGFLSPRREGGTGDGDIPSTWNPTTCMTGTWALLPWSLRRLSMAG